MTGTGRSVGANCAGRMTDVPQRLGVVGAGTMGAGIAQLGVLAGMDTLLHDPIPEALDRGVDYVKKNLKKGAERGRWSEENAAAGSDRLTSAAEIGDLEGCSFVIEAAPEKFELKRDLFRQVGEVCGPDAVLASNTSSIPVTQIAGVAGNPENVIGLHFFNPAPLMKLVELIAALQSGERALMIGRTVGEAMGKRVIDAADGPGFLVNRCGRPFGLEALRLLQERIADVETIDAIVRAAGFRMGPFELQDLVGIDVGFEVSRSFHELSFGEPRWRPSPLSARMVAAGRLGRKSGRGWYEYPRDEREDPEAPAPGGGDGRAVVVTGALNIADELRASAAAAGF